MRGQSQPLRRRVKQVERVKPVLSVLKPLTNLVKATITPKGRLILSKVFVLDTNKQALNPVHPGRARILLSTGKAAVFKRYPFTIILKEALEHPQLEPLRLKLDPGSKTTGLAIVNDATGEVVFAAELSHRGQAIKESLDTRRTLRRSRRQRHTRYRKPRCAPRHAVIVSPLEGERT